MTSSPTLSPKQTQSLQELVAKVTGLNAITVAATATATAPDLGTSRRASVDTGPFVAAPFVAGLTNDRTDAHVAKLVTAVVARPWRRTSVDSATMADIEQKTRAAVVSGQPLAFSLPFGGYKSWRQQSFPHLNWAEVFWVDYLRCYAERLANLHQPGVVISLTCMRGVLDWVNNLRPADEAIYLSQLETLLSRQSSKRVLLELVDLSSLYPDKQALFTLLRKREQSMPDPTAPELASASRNLVRQGGVKDLNTLTEDQWQAAVNTSARRCAAMMSLEKRRQFNKFGPRIQLTHVPGASLALHIGSCQTAVAQPWVSSGYVLWHPERQIWLPCLSTRADTGQHPCCISIAHALGDVSPRLQTIPVAMPDMP